MNPQIKQKWLNALRSGEYQQTQNRLHDENGFCCLGVLCDLYGKENNVEWELEDDGTYYKFKYHTVVLPLPVVEWAGVGGYNPYIYSRSLTLSSLNDNGSTFNEIADLIEEQL
jgi:hypothetical protein